MASKWNWVTFSRWLVPTFSQQEIYCGAQAGRELRCGSPTHHLSPHLLQSPWRRLEPAEGRRPIGVAVSAMSRPTGLNEASG